MVCRVRLLKTVQVYGALMGVMCCNSACCVVVCGLRHCSANERPVWVVAVGKRILCRPCLSCTRGMYVLHVML